jgi:hypothetical protein
MIAAQRRHHGAAPGTRRQDGPTHGFPDLHKGHRTGGNGSGAFRQRATGPQGREIQSDAAALLHRDRAFLQGLKNARDRVFDRPHHEAVKKCDVSRRSGAGLNPAAR